MSPGDPTGPSEIRKSDSEIISEGEATLSIVQQGSPFVERLIPTVGTKIGKYELKEKLGSGGMSIVYKAHDLALDRFVALKLLLPQAGDRPIDSMRFQQEAKAASRLEHPNIVKVHDFNVTEDGAPYLVMSYLDGISLSDLIKREGGLEPGRWLSIMIQACDALSCAHENNVVHRDIKPSNFVLCQEKGNEVLKLVDFGIAKIETNDDQSLTKTGEVFGSPLYMSPEQCAGSKVDSRSDVYSLGCVMYEALAGKPPHSGENALATIVKHLQEMPAPLSSICRKIPQIESIDKIVLKCLEKKPEDRYPDTLSLRKELERLFLGQKVLGRTSNRRPILILAALVVLASGAFFAFDFSSKALKEQEKVKARVLKEQQLAQSQDLYRSAVGHIQGDKQYEVARRDLLKAVELAFKSDADQAFIARLFLELGNAEKGLSNNSNARSYYSKVAEMRLPSDRLSLAIKNAANRLLGNDARDRMDLPLAKVYFSKVLEYGQRQGRPRDTVVGLLELSDLTTDESEAKSLLKTALSLKGDEKNVAKEFKDFYARRLTYRYRDKVKAEMDQTRREKEERKKLREEQRKREEAEEKLSDQKADLEAERIKKFWSEGLVPEKQ